MSNGQEDDPLRRFVDLVDDTVVAQSKTVASLELAAQPLSGTGLGFQHSNLLVYASFEVRSQLPKVLLELPGRL